VSEAEPPTPRNLQLGPLRICAAVRLLSFWSNKATNMWYKLQQWCSIWHLYS